VLRLGTLPASRRLERWLTALDARQVLVSEADPRPLDPLARVAGQSEAGLVGWLAASGLGCGVSFVGEPPQAPGPAPAALALAEEQEARAVRAERELSEVRAQLAGLQSAAPADPLAGLPAEVVTKRIPTSHTKRNMASSFRKRMGRFTPNGRPLSTMARISRWQFSVSPDEVSIIPKPPARDTALAKGLRAIQPIGAWTMG
jgi:hypothetical protein